MHPLLGSLLDLLAPRRCAGCDALLGELEPPLCITCVRALPLWRRSDGCPRCSHTWHHPLPGERGAPTGASVPAPCPRCFAEGSALHRCYALLRYEGAPRRWLPGFKHTRLPFGPAPELWLVVEWLAAGLARQLANRHLPRPDLVVPMPLHARRRWRRGFNHATPIARSLAETLEVDWRPDALVRVRDTPPQAGLPEAARRLNVRGAFRAGPRLDAPTRVWIVDDVLTTGSTLDAAADALLEAGVAEVYGLALAATHDARRALRQSRRHPGLSGVDDPQGPESSVGSARPKP